MVWGSVRRICLWILALKGLKGLRHEDFDVLENHCLIGES